MTYYGECLFCGESVASPQTPMFQVTGWEEGRSGGGANKITGRRRVDGVVAHKPCVQAKLGRDARGIDPGTQGTII
jgi:hypothetical protein